MIRGGFAGWDGGETVDSRRGGGTASQPEQEIVALASRAALTNTARPICRKQTYPAWDGVCFPPLVSVFSLSEEPTFPASGFGPPLLPAWRADRPCQDC